MDPSASSLSSATHIPLTKARLRRRVKRRRTKPLRQLDLNVYVHGRLRGARGALFQTLVAKSPVRVASAFTGMATEIIALKRMGLPIQHVFMCDRNSVVRRLLQHNYPGVPILQSAGRELSELRGVTTDLFVAAFPSRPRAQPTPLRLELSCCVPRRFTSCREATRT